MGAPARLLQPTQPPSRPPRSHRHHLSMPLLSPCGFPLGHLLQANDAYAAKKQRAKQVPQSMLDELRMAAMACDPTANYPAK